MCSGTTCGMCEGWGVGVRSGCEGCKECWCKVWVRVSLRRLGWIGDGPTSNSTFHPNSRFNFPAMIPLWMFPLATVTGNTFVLKPSERDPGAAMFLARLAQDAGLPDGVLNVIHGVKESVEFICDHPDIKAISFVGSDHVVSCNENVHARMHTCTHTNVRMCTQTHAQK